uniref:CSON012280 protein n=1 Tax=Culicoides sonorensis TaxID=179676 RepID=A0A336LLL3_CULSO
MINTTTSLYLSQQEQNNKKQSTINKTDDNLFALESEQISKLFPKCRPKNCDVNLNPIIQSENKTSALIAGKSINMNNSNNVKQQQQHQQQKNPYSALYKGIDVSLKDIVRTRTPNTTPASTVLNSPDLNDFETKMHYGHGHPFSYHNQIKVGRSPVESCLDNMSLVDDYIAPSPISPTMSTQNLIVSPSSTISPQQNSQQHQQNRSINDMSDVVIFDDIGENTWRSMNNSNRNLSTSPIITDNEIRQMKHRYLNETYNVDDAISSHQQQKQQQQQQQQQESNNKGNTQKMIGGLQIADYEGSPRRFGSNATDHRQRSSNNKTSYISSPSMFPPRPGFPKRVMSSYQSSQHNNESNSSQCPQESGNNEMNVDLLVDQPPMSSDFESLLKNDSIFGDGPNNSNNLMGSGGGSPFELTSSFNNLSQSDLNTMLTNNKNASSTNNASAHQQQSKPLSFDYLYEFSETRKVLEEFFTCQTNNDKILEKLSDFNESDDIVDDCNFEHNFSNVLSNTENDDIIPTSHTSVMPITTTTTSSSTNIMNNSSSSVTNNTSYIGQKLAGNNKFTSNTNNDHHALDQHQQSSHSTSLYHHNQMHSHSNHGQKHNMDDLYEQHDIELFLDSGSRSSGELADNEVEHGHTRNFTLSPETTDYDSNCGDLDSEVSLRYTGLGGEFGLPNDVNGCVPNFARIYNSMPVLEDGLSSGHASDTENNNPNSISIQKDREMENEKYIDTTMDTSQTLISAIQTSVSSINNQQQKSRNTVALGYGISVDNEDIMGSNNKNNKDTLINTAATSPSFMPQMTGMNTNSSHINTPPVLSVTPNNTLNTNNSANSAVNQLLMNQKRNNQPNSNNLTNFLSSQLPSNSLNNPCVLMSSPCNTEREIKDVTNQIIQNNINNTSRQQQQQQQSSSKKGGDIDLDTLYSALNIVESTPPPPAPVPHRISSGYGHENNTGQHQNEVQNTLKDIRSTLQKTQKLPLTHETPETSYDNPVSPEPPSPVWIPRHPDNSRESFDSDQPSKLLSADEEEADTDLETDRLLGQQRLDDQGFFDDKVRNNWSDRTSRLRASVRSPLISPAVTATNTSSVNNATRLSPQSNNKSQINNQSNNSQVISNNKSHSSITRQGVGTTLSPDKSSSSVIIGGGGVGLEQTKDDLSPTRLHKSPTGSIDSSKKDDDRGSKTGKSKSKEGLLDPAVLIEGVLFRARYLGSTQLVCEGQPTKSTRMMQAEEAVSRIKAPEGESQPSTEVDLFISTEKIMVLNTDLKEIMMDHALRTISYIADIGDLVVLMARRRFVQQDSATDNALGLIGGTNDVGQTGSATKGNRTPKMICHVFESEEAQFIAQSIGQAFQVAYMEFLKANGIEDHSFMKEMDYQEVLNSQEIFGDELEIFAKKELQKEVVVPKAKGEILGVVIVESGWGSMLPTVVIANLASNGAAARCGQLNIGDQIIAINGLSLVGLPLSTCQSYIKNTKNQTAVKFTVVPCAPVVEVKIKRPNTKYQLGFSVQNGVICSLLRGGIAERGGVRVGHRIIEINNQSVVAVPHEKIVNLLATSVGEILMKTMPTSMFRLLTGQENPVYI